MKKLDLFKLYTKEKIINLGTEAPIWENPKKMRLFYRISYILNFISAILIVGYYLFIIFSLIADGSTNSKITSNSTTENNQTSPKRKFRNILSIDSIDDSILNETASKNIINNFYDFFLHSNKSFQMFHHPFSDAHHKRKLTWLKIIHEIEGEYILTKNEILNFPRDVEILEKSIHLKEKELKFLQATTSNTISNTTYNTTSNTTSNSTSNTISKAETFNICLKEFLNFEGCGRKILNDAFLIISGILLFLNTIYNNLMSKVRYLSDDEWSIVYFIGFSIIGVLIFINVFQFIEIVYQNRIINDSSTIESSQCEFGRNASFRSVNFTANLTYWKNMYPEKILELKTSCMVYYKTIFGLNTINAFLLTGLCAIQASMIIFKFYYYFINSDFAEENYATMRDFKVVVHSF